jgi:endo-1,4-beta-xylanase
LANAVARECGILVPEGALKWRALRPAPDRFDFHGGDTILQFASLHGQLVRGHTLVWHQALPDWFGSVAGPGNAGSLLASHIETVCGHYAGRLQAWDVVNEVVDARAPGGLRNTPWLRFLGQGYIADAFRLAHAADPAAVLFLNDYGLEPDTATAKAKRLAVLALLRRLLDAGAPVQGLGLQAHLVAGDRFDSLADFLEQVRALGLRVAVTELDVSDERLPGTPLQRRDAAVAATYASFLHEALAVPGLVREVLTWGLTDATSWLQAYQPRPDGLPKRPLPLDDALARKPAWAAIRTAFQAAGAR